MKFDLKPKLWTLILEEDIGFFTPYTKIYFYIDLTCIFKRSKPPISIFLKYQPPNRSITNRYTYIEGFTNTGVLTSALDIPSWTGSKSDLVIRGNQDMKNSNVVHANYSTELVYDLQKALVNKKNSVILDNLEISKESYEKIFEIAKSFNSAKVFTEISSDSIKTYLFCENEFLLSLKKSKEFNTYSINQSFVSSAIFEKIEEFYVEYIDKQPLVEWCTAISNGEPKTVTLPVKIPSEYNHLAYPNLNKIEDISEKFFKSNANILILQSPPGMGKSTWLKYLLHYSSKRCLVASNEILVGNNADILLSYFIQEKSLDILIIEDADNLLKARSKDSNNASFMKNLLNLGDGLISNPSKKIILTTNLPSLKDVDEALHRKGRCFGVFRLEPYTPDQALAYLNDVKKDYPDYLEFDVNAHKSLTLAQLHSALAGDSVESFVETRGVGFL